MTLFKSAPFSLCLAASALLFAHAAQAQVAKPAAPASAAAPSAEMAKQADGQLAAAGWLSMLDRGNWGGAYEASSQLFRNMVPIGAWMDSIPGVRAPFGAFESRTASTVAYKTTLAGRPDGEYVTAIFDAHFADKKDVEEIVTTVREADGQWRVIGYQPR
jgi:soluble lytic murein transglycosylase-like protein